MDVGNIASVEVTAIANGFLIREKLNGDYKVAASEWVFYPTREAVEQEVLSHFRAASQLDLTVAEPDF